MTYAPKHIQTREDLDALRRSHGMGFIPRPAPPPRIPDFPVAWNIHGPRDGLSYTFAEAARICNVSVRTIGNWIATGRRGVKLDALRVPRGRIAPQALCRFLSKVNRFPVKVGMFPRRRRDEEV